MSKYQNGLVRLTVSYGYDVHSIEMPVSTWQQIQVGEVVTVQGQGFYIEGEFSQDEWAFSLNEVGTVQVTAEGSFNIFSGLLSDITLGVV